MEQSIIDRIFLECISDTKKIERSSLDFPKLLLATNPFTIYDDMEPSEIVNKILDKHIEKSEETIAGILLECVAIKINNQIQGGIKSIEEDVDLEVKVTNSYYGLKNSPKWGNANQQKAVSQTNEKMKKLGKNFAILTLYGRTVKRTVEKFEQYGGQDSWYIISGETDKNMYKKVALAKNNNKDAYRQFIENCYNCDRERAVSWITNNFCNNNKINLDKIYEFISGRNKIEVTKW